jgi:hypothetical protein
MDLSPCPPHPHSLDLRDTPPPPPPLLMDLSPYRHHLHPPLLDLRDTVVAMGLVNSYFLQWARRWWVRVGAEPIPLLLLHILFCLFLHVAIVLLDVAIDDSWMLQWDSWVVATDDFSNISSLCFMVNFCDVVILPFEMVQHIILDGATYNFYVAVHVYSMLQYMLFSMLQCSVFNIAAYNFWCCSTYFFNVVVYVFWCCTTYFSNVAVFIFWCCTCERVTLGTGDRGAMENGTQWGNKARWRMGCHGGTGCSGENGERERGGERK